ncbi:Di-copper centre-containing protein [Stipitochalara longipes BDJ]|nr:Di-copper centre-containing protein [Stipitochalara longipes BDJ]
MICLTAIVTIKVAHGTPRLSLVSNDKCLNPSHRREWRQLSRDQKAKYISAVKCLHELPSKVTGNGRLSDDFPWVHRHIGSFTHDAASFLPWHRYFLHLYELELRESCGYEGGLTFWDWTLDWEDPSQSPVWDPFTGFGGDGSLGEITTVGFGSCVRDGPFANYEVHYYNFTTHPHCLSRGFSRQHENQQFYGDEFSPAVIENIHQQEEFFSFSLGLEMGPHDAIPNLINGDFFSFEAPNDPLFFLHHTQLDRLWWLWQKESPNRIREYNGRMESNSDQPASVNDRLPMDSLGVTIEVQDVLSTESSTLCYVY